MTPPITLIELTFDQVVGFNRKAIADAHRKDAKSREYHSISRANDLHSLLGAVFYRDYHGVYAHAPIENIAAFLLYRIAEGQCFVNGNKRTALLSCYFFLYNNGYHLHIDRGQVNALLWGFAKDPNDPSLPPRYGVNDAVKYIEDNLSLRP